MKLPDMRAAVLFAVFTIIFILPGPCPVYGLHDLFKSIDNNVDGEIKEEEFSENMKKRAFEKIDTDSSMTISGAEWAGIEGVTDIRMHDELFRRIDKDSDRRITFFEFSDYAESNSNIHESFIGLDKDGSDSLSPDEISVRPLFKMITIKFR